MNTMMRGFMLAGGLATLVAFAQPNTASAEGPKLPATVTVTNMRSGPVAVYLDRGPFDFRLGTVGAHSEKTLSVPSYMTENESVRVFVRTEDGWDLETPDLDVTPGASLKVLVPVNNVGFIPRPPAEVIPNPGSSVTTITVHNSRAQDVTLYVERGEFDYRVGTVPARQEATLQVAPWLARGDPEVRVFVEPKNREELASDDVTLTPGAHLFVNVPVR